MSRTVTCALVALVTATVGCGNSDSNRPAVDGSGRLQHAADAVEFDDQTIAVLRHDTSIERNAAVRDQFGLTALILNFDRRELRLKDRLPAGRFLQQIESREQFIQRNVRMATLVERLRASR